MVMAAPVASQAKNKSRHHVKKTAEVAAQPVDNNEASWRLLKDGSWLLMPSWSLPIVMKMKKDQEEKDAAAARHGKRMKQAAQ